jgi:hypothetical protein
MLIINNRFLSVYDYNFLLVIEKIFSLKPTILKSQVKTKPVTQLITNNKKKSEMKRTGN